MGTKIKMSIVELRYSFDFILKVSTATGTVAGHILVQPDREFWSLDIEIWASFVICNLLFGIFPV
jgi:hypothetical protein